MVFCTPAEILERAREEGWAVPAFNTNGGCYDIANAAVEAAEAAAAPLILQTYENNLAYRGFRHAAGIARVCAETATVPVALQLDHGHSVDSCRRALDAGYSAVMIDASALPYDDNVRVVRRVVEMAHARGAAVEAEIGHIAIRSQEHAPTETVPKTDPEEAHRFAAETGVDALAVAIGTMHGLFDEQTTIDFSLIRELRDAVSVPLVLHGTCGIPDDHLARAVECGIAKANFGEVFRAPYVEWFAELARTMPHEGHPWRIQQAIKDRLRARMLELIRILGAEGKARS